MSHVFASSLTASSTKCANLTCLPLDIMHFSHIWHDYLWPWVFLTWLLYNLQLWRHGRWFQKFTIRFRPIRKDIVQCIINLLIDGFSKCHGVCHNNNEVSCVTNLLVLRVTNAGKFQLNMNFWVFVEEETNKLLRRSNMCSFFIWALANTQQTTFLESS